ncbi:hypothetical protein [Clostridium gasigenes]|uniref:Protein CcmA, bactofilin family n=1 Tax=Clostridium gasigenes TaxID=94869 RepID=A0A7X0SCH5_9CLOT|nr:hypothetical protein [Clostridium gasigenes]MBB6715029.1 hypothetical protein [Clostridium gasigenes]
MSELKNINISGVGTLDGGEYDKIILSGATKIMSYAKGNKIIASGSCTSFANLEGGYINISGAMKSEGGLISSDLIQISGSTKVDFIKATTLNISGTTKVNNDCTFDKVRISGNLNIDGSCEGRDFKASARLVIGKLLSADIVEINIEGKSSISEIGGEKITIRKGLSLLGFSIFPILKKELSCDSIEGDTIYLENTICKVVRGKNIIIGEGCNINKIEYSGTLTVDKRSEVGERECMKN